jgi:hypothetical protein
MKVIKTMNRTPALIFYDIQPIDVEDKEQMLHLQADDHKDVRTLKRWLHKNCYRKIYYYDSVAEYYTIKRNGRTYLEMLEKDNNFQMVRGIPEL